MLWVAGGQGPDDRAAVEAGLAAITAHDPAFDEAAFLAQTRRVFDAIAQAEQEMRPDLTRPFYEANQWQVEQARFREALRGDRRIVFGDFGVDSAAIMEASSDTAFDTILVRLTCHFSLAATDAAGHPVEGDTVVRPHIQDVWFHRRSTATTRPDGGTLSQRCPNCGAPLLFDASGGCRYCHAQVTTGDYDWVVVRWEQRL